MKKYSYYIFLGVFAILAASILIFKKKQPEQIPQLLERQGAISMTSEWLNTKAAIEGLLQKLRQNPNDNDSKIKLAYAYIQEGRTTGNYMYYDAAALQLANDVYDAQSDKKSDKCFQALCIKATIYLNQHHFYDGLQLAEQAQAIDPYSSFVYGCLTDANVELGHYNDAIKMGDKMCAIRPDMRSYSRISYLREIMGNMNGSIKAMNAAVKCGLTGLEQTEWARVQLGKLYEINGKLDSAQMQYTMAITYRPNYAFAIAGLGRVAEANKNYPIAIKYFEQAKSLLPSEYSFPDELTDLYRLNGETQKAEQNSKAVITLLSKDAKAATDNNNIGHYADKELALAYIKADDFDNALSHAQAEYDRRPDNIDVNETLAWVYYKKGDYTNAEKYIKVAMRTGCEVPTLLCHAGLIYAKNGDLKHGQALIDKAFQEDPFLSSDLQNEARPFLAMN